MKREEAIKLLVNATYSDEWQGNKDLTTAHNMAIKALEERPTGKWIIDDLDELNRIWKCHCSKCDKNPLDYVSGTENWWIYKKQMPKYCPSCGAVMSEVE